MLQPSDIYSVLHSDITKSIVKHKYRRRRGFRADLASAVATTLDKALDEAVRRIRARS